MYVCVERVYVCLLVCLCATGYTNMGEAIIDTADKHLTHLHDLNPVQSLYAAAIEIYLSIYDVRLVTCYLGYTCK